MFFKREHILFLEILILSDFYSENNNVQLISKLSSTPQKSRSRFITDFSTCKDAFLKFERHIFYIG
jgi:hypothetical protein